MAARGGEDTRGTRRRRDRMAVTGTCRIKWWGRAGRGGRGAAPWSRPWPPSTASALRRPAQTPGPAPGGRRGSRWRGAARRRSTARGGVRTRLRPWSRRPGAPGPSAGPGCTAGRRRRAAGSEARRRQARCKHNACYIWNPLFAGGDRRGVSTAEDGGLVAGGLVTVV